MPPPPTHCPRPLVITTGYGRVHRVDVHLRDLRYFVAVAEEEHVTRAAQRLFVSQPALSKQLRALEAQLGLPLLERLPRGVALTPQGRALLPEARTLLLAWDEAVAAARAQSPARALIVGIQTAVGRGLQRRAFAAFRAAMPGWVPSIRLVPWSDPSSGLADGSSDLAFVWLPTPGDVSVLTVAREPRHVAFAEDHRLASAAAVDISDLLDEPFVALPDSAGPLRDFWLAVPERGRRAPAVAAVAESADAVLEMVASGLGVALIAEGNATVYSRPGVVTRPVTGLGPATLALAWRASDRRPAVAAFVRAVSEALDWPPG